MTLILSGTNGVSDIDGDASTPAVRGTDANSGIFFGADTVGVSTGGSEKVSVGASAVVVNDGGADVDFRVEGDTDANLLFVDASADKVGIGTNAPSEKLTLSASSSSTYTSGLSSEANPIGTNVRIQNTSATTDTFAGITFNPVNGGSQGQLAYVGGISTGSGLGADIVFGGRAASGFYAERMRIDSSGNLLVGTTSAAGSRFFIEYSGGAVVGQSINDSDNTNNSTFVQFQIQGTQVGTIKRVGTTSAVIYNTSSDYRLKTVIGAVTGHGARIDALKPIVFQWKESGQQAKGFLAHEFQEVYASSVSGDKDALDANGKPVYQSMQASTSEVIADLVAELQSLRARVAVLESN